MAIVKDRPTPWEPAGSFIHSAMFRWRSPGCGEARPDQAERRSRPASLAAREVDWDTGRHGVEHPAGVWLGNEPVREMTVFSPGNEMSISLLLYPDQAPSRWEMAELEEEDAVDTFDKFTGHMPREQYIHGPHSAHRTFNVLPIK